MIKYFNRQLNDLLGRGVDHLPHAMLLVGPEGVGKSVFAENLALRLLCESPVGHAACGTCQACRWLAGGNHPDFRHVKPGSDEADEEGGREKGKKRGNGIIRIDQIRELESFVFVGSHRMGRRIVLISEAEAMNNAAANSLLKILEEPPVSVYFILTSSRQRFLLPTIRSRCRTIGFATPAEGDADEILKDSGIELKERRFLALAGGAPMLVKKWKDSGVLTPLQALIDTLGSAPADPINLAARWDGLVKGDPAFTLEHLVEEIQRWIFDLAQERASGSVRYHADWKQGRPTSGGHDPTPLFAFWHELMRFRRSARHPLNQLLFIEDLATHFLRALRT